MDEWMETLSAWAGSTGGMALAVAAVLVGWFVVVPAIRRMGGGGQRPPEPRRWDYRDNGGPGNRDRF